MIKYQLNQQQRSELMSLSKELDSILSDYLSQDAIDFFVYRFLRSEITTILKFVLEKRFFYPNQCHVSNLYNNISEILLLNYKNRINRHVSDDILTVIYKLQRFLDKYAIKREEQ